MGFLWCCETQRGASNTVSPVEQVMRSHEAVY